MYFMPQNQDNVGKVGSQWQLFYSRDVDKCDEKSKLLSVPPSGSGTTTAAASGTVVRSSSAPSDFT